jgi:hypothetical protein
MVTHTIRISESAYVWIKNKSAYKSKHGRSTSKIVDILISNFDDTFEKYTVTEESKKIKQRLLEIDVNMYNLSDEKESLLNELSAYGKTKRLKKPNDVEERKSDSDELFEDESEEELITKIEKTIDYAKMMKTPLF